MNKNRIQSLIEIVYQKGMYVNEGQQAIDQLVQIGNPALDLMIESLDKPPNSDLHGRDLWDSIQATFNAFARTMPDRLIDALEDNSLGEHIVYWALGNATGDRSIDTLVRGLKDERPTMRWMAAESLIRRRSKRAVPALLDALRDRSSMVKSTVVFAMKSNKMYRKPEAILALERIVASKSMKQHSVGTWKTAQEVLEKIRKETK